MKLSPATAPTEAALLLVRVLALPAALPILLTTLIVATTATAAAAPENLVVTASRSGIDPLALSGNVAAISEDALRLTAATHPYEVAVRVPGAWISRNSGQEQLTAIRSPVLTGPGSCGAFLVLEDGIATRPTGFCNVNQLFEVPTELAERIEVIRGPANAWFGSNGLHGTINTLLPDPGEDTTAVTLETGSNNYWRASLRQDGRTERTAYSSGILIDDNGGYREESGYKQWKGFFKGSQQYSVGTLDFGLTLSELDQETAGFITGPLAYRDLATRFSNPNPEAFRKAGSRRASATWTPTAGDTWQQQWRVFARNSDMDFLQHFLPGKPLEENGQTSGGALYTARRAIAGDGEWALGIDTEIARGYLKETQENPAVGSAFLVETRPVGKHYDYRVNSALLAAHSNIRLPLTQRLELQGGIRFEVLRYDYDNQMGSGNTRDDGVTPCGFGGCQYSRPEDRDDTFRNVAPNLGLSFRLDESNTLFASATHGFRAPQTTELYRLQRGQSVADIDSEELNAVEAGWRHRGDSLSLETAVYLMRKKNFIFRDATDANVSNGKTRHAGIEINAAWQVAEYWYVGLTGSHAKQEYRFTRSADLGEEILRGNDIDTAPRTLASARVGYADARTTAELEWVYMDSYFMDAANTTRYDGHRLVNLRVLFDLTNSLTAGLRLNNLTDKVYADRADLLAVSSPPTERYFPGRPREIYVSLRWRR